MTVRANPNRAGPGRTVVGLQVTQSDGTDRCTCSRRRFQRPAAHRADGLAGRWVPLLTGLQGLVQGARTWPLTDAGRTGIADVKSQQASQSGCSPWPAPMLMALGVMRTIEVSANMIVLRFDWMKRRANHSFGSQRTSSQCCAECAGTFDRSLGRLGAGDRHGGVHSPPRGRRLGSLPARVST